MLPACSGVPWPDTPPPPPPLSHGGEEISSLSSVAEAQNRTEVKPPELLQEGEEESILPMLRDIRQVRQHRSAEQWIGAKSPAKAIADWISSPSNCCGARH